MAKQRGEFLVDGAHKRFAIEWSMQTETDEILYGPTFNPNEAHTAETRGGTLPGGTIERIFVEPDSEVEFERLDGASGVLIRDGEPDVRGTLRAQGRQRLVLDRG